MKMIIDIPDNELKDPLRNIHLLTSNGIVEEVCIKKYDKDKPYFMNLNYAPLSESEDCVSRQAAINIVVCDILSSAIVYGRTEEGMAAKKAIVEGLKRLPSVTPAEKVGQWEWNQYDSNPKIGNWHCSQCHGIGKSYYDYCPSCGRKMQEVEE